jgi:hypothetical protein
VKAIKRAISHAQRFLPWVPEEWDDIYDDVIAHGDGSGIDRSGVAGFQQQMGIEPTGWVGQATFEALRTCLIPSKPGVPHAGEPLFDAVCVRLFKQAAELPAPEEPTTLEPEHPIEPSHGDYDSYAGAFRKAKFTRLGGPAAHRAKALAGWESDNAFDYGLPVGTPLYALDDGVIGGNLGPMESNPSDGSRVQLNADSNAYWYGHLSRVVVQSGQRVKRGQLLGYSGASSNGAAHLHLGVQHLDRG